MREVDVTDAERRFPELVDEAEAGGIIIITRDGAAIVKISPMADSARDCETT